MCSLEQECYIKHFKVGQVTKRLVFMGENILLESEVGWRIGLTKEFL